VVCGVVILVALCAAAGVRADVVLTSVEAESMTLPGGTTVVADPSASGGSVVRLTTASVLVAGLALTERSTSFVLRARGEACRGNAPRVNVLVDGTRVLNQLVTQTQLTELPVSVSLPAGSHELRLTLTNAASNATCSRALIFDVTRFLTPSPPTPTLSLTAAETQVAYGAATTLNWASTGADACVASGSWSGARTPIGSEGTGPLTAGRSYSLTCTGLGGAVTQTVAVAVAAPPPPAVTLSATPPSVEVGETAQLVWSSSNTDSCEASGDWTGARGVSGSEPTGTRLDPAIASYTLTCSGLGGQVAATATVEFTEAPPPPPLAVSLTATPTTVLIGESATLAWAAPGADGCEAANAWGGPRDAAGSESTGPLLAEGTVTFELTCTGSGETETASAVVTVELPPPPTTPTVALGATATQLAHGEATTLNWTSTDTEECTATGGWTGPRLPSGSFGTGPLTASQTYDLTCTGPGGQAFSSVTVTVAPPPASCTTANTAGCVAGSEIVVTNAGWTCSQALSTYGARPLRVTVLATTVFNNPGVTLTTGCAGDADPASIDLILDVRGDGLTYGSSDDAVKVKLQAGYTAGIQITGTVNCGPRPATGHQDGVQAQGGRNLSFVDFSVGNWEAGISTCQGAGGAFFYSGANGYSAQSTHVIRGKYIACSKGIAAGGGQTGSVSGALFRSGRTDGTDPACVGFAAPRTCVVASQIGWANATCEKWNALTDRWNLST
jgi:hypothetical protein